MRVQRFDAGELRPPKKTAAGFLRLDGRATRTGIFVYRNADGSERRELRRAEQVFDAASLETLAGAPLCLLHPEGLVTPENARQHQVGQVGDQVRRDGQWVALGMTVTDRKAIEAIEKGDARQLSCGYSAEILDGGGEYHGERYDCEQTQIVYNHLALVPQARAGEGATVRLDSGAAVMLSCVATREDTEIKPMATKIRIDGVEYEVSEQAAQAIVKVDAAHATEVKTLGERIAAVTKERDTAAARADAAEADAKKEKARADAASDPAKLAAAVKARVDLEVAARRHLGADAKLDALTDRQIKEAVVLKADKDAKLTNKSDDYLQARYDVAVNAQPAGNASADAVRAAATGQAPIVVADAAELDEAAAYERYKKDSRNAWKQASK